ncbi:DUF4861 family protein [Phenylobacterium deserti]|nr:DUF4861 family protein [Phenylobacterium deserti]
MLRHPSALALAASLLVAGVAQAQTQVDLVAENTEPVARKDALIEAPASLLTRVDRRNLAWTAAVDGRPAPAQAIDRNGDGFIEAVVLVADFRPNQRRRITLRPGAAETSSRVQAVLNVQAGATKTGETFQGGRFEPAARLDVPAEHTVHDNLIAMEGPAWESDKVGYRLYLDGRNVTDVYGKKQPELVLHRIGLGQDDYHAEAAWGMDVLKVGEALGVGGLGVVRGAMAEQIGQVDSISAAVEANGPVIAAVRVDDRGVRVGDGRTDLTARYEITAGSRLTWVRARAGADAPLAAGLVKHPGVTVLQSASGGDWAYLASWGPQAENRDDLGLALFYRVDEAKPADDGRSLYVRFGEPQNVRYAFAAVWTKDGDIHDLAAFRAELDRTLAELEHPIRVAPLR